MFNKVILIGNLTKDPELRYTSNGKAVATLSLAVNTRINNGQDEKLYIDIVVWEGLAETSAKHLSKGRQILVEGRLRQRRWEKDGQRHQKDEVVATTIKFLGSKPGGTTPPEEITEEEPF